MCSDGWGAWSALELSHDGVPYSQEDGSRQGSVGLAINLSHHRPFFQDCIEENESSLCVTENHSICPKALKKHVHPLHIGVRVMVCCIHIRSYLRNARGSKPGPEVCPGLGTCHTDVRAKCLWDVRADYALQLRFSQGGSPSDCFHRLHASNSTSSNAPEVLGLEVVPHLLFPDSEIWACEDRNGGGKIVVGGGHFKRVSVKKTYHQLTVDNDDLKRKNSSALQRFHAYVWCTRS